MMWRMYILGLVAGYYLLWGYFSHWDPHLMIFWEGNEDMKGPLLRVGAGFFMFVTAAYALLSEHKP